MKKKFLLFVFLFVITAQLFSRVIKVDINGSGQFTSISVALNAAVAGDTIKVLPGNYFEQVTINKNVIVMGSGFETTTINSASDPTLKMSAGKIQWFSISSTSGSGISVAGNNTIITNCVIRGCTSNGIQANIGAGTVTVLNCNLLYNGGYGIVSGVDVTINATNCISMLNGKSGYYADSYWSGGLINLSFCNGTIGGSSTQGKQGCINLDPQFVSSSDLHISQGSPCWDKGNPSLFDPDGSQSDMGYFGGPDCPIYPVVKNITLIPQSDGSVKIQATGVANY